MSANDDQAMSLEELESNRAAFLHTIRSRDLREIVVAVLMVPVWIAMGVGLALPWSWYLTLPALVWIAGFMYADYRRHGRSSEQASGRAQAMTFLADVERQVGLLRNVAWWYLLPLMIPMVAFFAEVTWRTPGSGWERAIVFSLLFGFVAIVFAFVYRLNRQALRNDLLPRREALRALLESLNGADR